MTRPSTSAGWAQIDITPPLGLPMGGRGPKLTPGAAVLDPLSAQALVLQDAAARRLVVVSLDLIGLSRPIAWPLRQALAAAAGVSPAQVVINFAHTHSGPNVDIDHFIAIVALPESVTRYQQRLGAQLVELVRDAVGRLSPAAVRWHEGRSMIAMNRRKRLPSGKCEMRPDPTGTHNPDLWALHVQSAAAQAVLFCHACHPVIVYGFAYDGISADYPGQCRRRLAERLGPDAHCQFVQSFCGNVRPRVLADLEAGVWRKSTPADLVAVGNELADDVLAALASPGEPLDLQLAAAETSFAARTGEPPPQSHWEAFKTHEDPFYRGLADYWLARLQSGPQPLGSLDLPVGLARLTPRHWIAWMGGEVLAEWLGLIRDWLNKPRLMTWGYSQHVEAYVPTDGLLDEGGYEVDSSNWFCRTGPARFAPGLNAAAREAFLSLRTVI